VVPPGLTYATGEERRRGRVVEVLVRLIFRRRVAQAQALRRSRVSRRINVSFLKRYNATDRRPDDRKVREPCTFSKNWRGHEAMIGFQDVQR
jgi:hypothetical protein